LQTNEKNVLSHGDCLNRSVKTYIGIILQAINHVKHTDKHDYTTNVVLNIAKMYGLVCSINADGIGSVVAMASGSITLFAQRVRRLRKAAKLSREKAAERGGISPNFWGEVERGESEPGLESIFRIAKGLQIAPSALLTDKEEDSNLLRKTQQLAEKATPDQLVLLYRVGKAIVG